MTRKFFALLLALAMIFALAACGQQAAPAASGDAGLIKVGIINLDPAESGYREANVKNLTDTFTKENGYDATFVTAPTADKQLEAAKGFITAQVKYILVSAAETTGWDEVLTEAKEAGIKVFLFDRMIDCDPSLYTAAVVSDMRQEGETAVAWLESLELDEYKILHIQGQPRRTTGPSFVKAPAATAGTRTRLVRSPRPRSTPAKSSTSSTPRTTAWPAALWKLWTPRASPTV